MLMLTRAGERGKDESTNAWEMYESMLGMPRRKLIIVAFGWNLKNMA